MVSASTPISSSTTPTSKRILIVGGVAGGASAAARARRLSEDAEIVLFERGEHISFANCGLPYHIGGAISDRKQLLLQTPQNMYQRYRVIVKTKTEVRRIDREKRELIVRDLATGTERAERYDALILSPGAEPVRPPLPGIQSPRVLTLRSLADMDAIKTVVDDEKPAQALVVGGGYIGLEMAEALRERGLGVILVELAEQVMNVVDPEMAVPLHQELRLNGVDLRLGASVKSFEEKNGLLSVALSSGDVVVCGLAILAIGVKPEVSLAREAGLKLGERGGIVVDAQMRTSDPAIYAAGDAVEVLDFLTGTPALIPLAGPANRQGRIAADNIFGRNSAYRKTQGTAICKVFNLAIGMTGLSEKALKRAGRAYEKVYIHPPSHAEYYPRAAALTMKLLFDPQNGKILGAQAAGTDGVDKRIDVLAVALRAGLTVFDLEEQELCYAPPYGSAKDPVNYLGFAAANVLRKDVQLCSFEEVQQPSAGQVVLDVRPTELRCVGTIPGSVHIPLDELRDRLNELPREKDILVICQVGLRGYIACRMLSQRGFRCRNFSGGFKTYAALGGRVLGAQPPAGPAQPAAPVPAARSASATSGSSGAPLKIVDACGLQCPGPIMRLKSELEPLEFGQALTIVASDPGFASDVKGWCQSTGNELLGMNAKNGAYEATIRKGVAAAPAPAAVSGAVPGASKRKTIVVFSNDFDRAMAAFIIANGAAAMGSTVTLFFTFWGLNILRKAEPVPVRKTLVESMFGWMMPRGAGALTLSKMHMGGMGTWMMQRIMKKKNVSSLAELIASARKNGVRMVACSMSMDLMGIKAEELIDGVESGGVAMFLNEAEQGNVNLFI